MPHLHLTRNPSAFWLALWLGVALCVAKIIQPQDPYDHFAETRGERLRDIAVICHQDVLFAMGVGLVGAVLLRSTARRSRLHRWTWRALVAFCVVSLLYTIASVPAFAFLGTPLTYGLIHVAGDFVNMRSSLGAFITPKLAMSLIVAPFAYLGLVWLCNRFLRPPRGRWWIRALMLADLAAVVVYFCWARGIYNGDWADRDGWRLAQNPHWVIVSTTTRQLFGGDSVKLAADFPPQYADDFKPIGAGPTATTIASSTLPAARPKNVILIVLESVGTQHLSLYGSEFATMPRLEAESKNALVFDNVYSYVGMTANSLVTILLSEFPPITWKQTTIEQPDFPGTSLAQVLGPRGYRTMYVTSGDNGYVKTARFLANRGFDDIWDEDQLNCPSLFTWGVEDRCMFDAMRRWIDRGPREKPFFIMAWTQQTHHPYGVAEEGEAIDFLHGRSVCGDDYHLNLYLNAVHEADRLIGQLMDDLRQRGLADDTLIVITGDHGEAFGAPHRVYAHGERLYQECMNVPFVLWNPRMFGGGAAGRSKTIGGLIDLCPTVLDAIGAAPTPSSWRGRSLLDPQHPPRTYFYAVNNDYLLGVRQDDWKYIFNATRGRDELFELTRDPQEQQNIAATHPDVCRELRQRVSAWINTAQQPRAR